MRPAPFIYVMENRFVLVGRPLAHNPDALFIGLTDAAVIRRWGTTRGLGQLAFEGPQQATALDPEPYGVRILVTAIQREIPCNQAAWANWTTSTSSLPVTDAKNRART